MTSSELHEAVLTKLETFDVDKYREHFVLVGEGQKNEIYNISGRNNKYYQYLFCLNELLKPKQEIEIGAAAGISTILMCLSLPKESVFYSVDIDPMSWRWMNADYPQLVKLLGSSTDMNIWPKGVDLSKTNVWFMDSLHEEQQLRAEVELYKPFWKKGTVILFDDIHLNDGMERVWNDLNGDKLDISDPCHYSGFGLLMT